MKLLLLLFIIKLLARLNNFKPNIIVSETCESWAFVITVDPRFSEP